MSDASERLQRIVEGGTDEDLVAWAATGRAGLIALRDVLTGSDTAPGPRIHPRDALDNLTAAVAAIAAAHPSAFLEVFADPQFDASGYVLVGLGYVNDSRAATRLTRATESDNHWIRMDAAIGLGRQKASVASGALAGLLRDSEYLVRYHALQGLAAVGDEAALEALREFEAHTPIERQLADRAMSAISARFAGPLD